MLAYHTVEICPYIYTLTILLGQWFSKWGIVIAIQQYNCLHWVTVDGHRGLLPITANATVFWVFGRQLTFNFRYHCFFSLSKKKLIILTKSECIIN